MKYITIIKKSLMVRSPWTITMFSYPIQTHQNQTRWFLTKFLLNRKIIQFIHYHFYQSFITPKDNSDLSNSIKGLLHQKIIRIYPILF